MERFNQYLRKLAVGLAVTFAFSLNAKADVELNTTLSVMTYNAENLFDDRHDPGKSDWSYLPLSTKYSDPHILEECRSMSNSYYRERCLEMDWNRDVVRSKIENLARVIKSYDRGKGPDILVLQEIENIRVLHLLNEWGNLNYREVVLIEGPDKRGIDVGILSRYPLDSRAEIHKIDFRELRNRGIHAKDTRPLLEATFRIGGKKLTVIGNHWSSQGNVDETRHVIAKTLYRVGSQVRNGPVIALGDFNTMPDDNPHGIRSFITNSSLTHSYIDARTKAPFRHKGTHFFRGEWSDLDRIFIKRSSICKRGRNTNCLAPIWDSYEVVKPSFAVKDYVYSDPNGQTTRYKDIPWRFEWESERGYSDHLAVAIKVRI